MVKVNTNIISDYHGLKRMLILHKLEPIKI